MVEVPAQAEVLARQLALVPARLVPPAPVQAPAQAPPPVQAAQSESAQESALLTGFHLDEVQGLVRDFQGLE